MEVIQTEDSLVVFAFGVGCCLCLLQDLAVLDIDLLNLLLGKHWAALRVYFLHRLMIASYVLIFNCR